MVIYEAFSSTLTAVLRVLREPRTYLPLPFSIWTPPDLTWLVIHGFALHLQLGAPPNTTVVALSLVADILNLHLLVSRLQQKPLLPDQLERYLVNRS